MKQLKTVVTYKVPEGIYCNHVLRKTNPTTRCRFCTDLGKMGFTCVLHNYQLPVTEGILIHKCKDCLNKAGIATDTPAVAPRDLIKHALGSYRALYQALIKQGIPEAIADKMAQEEVMK